MPQFTDLTTALNATSLDALVPAGQSYLVSGTIPVSGSAGAVAMPALQFVGVASGTATYYTQTSASVTTPAGDTYIDLTPNVSGTGTYVATTVTHGAAAPALAAGNVRLALAYNNGTTIVVTQLASPQALAPGQIAQSASEAGSLDTLTATSSLQNTLNRMWFKLNAAGTAGPYAQTIISPDLTEAATLDTLSGGSSLLNNLNRIRNSLTVLTGAGFVATKRAISSDGSGAGVAVSFPGTFTTTGLTTHNAGLNVASGSTSLQGLAVNGSATFASTVTAGGAVTAPSFLASGGTPSFTPDPAYSPTPPTVTGHNMAAKLTFNFTHTFGPAGTSDSIHLGSFLYNGALPGTPVVAITPANSVLTGLLLFSANNFSTTGFDIFCSNTQPSSITLTNWAVGLNIISISM